MDFVTIEEKSSQLVCWMMIQLGKQETVRVNTRGFAELTHKFIERCERAGIELEDRVGDWLVFRLAKGGDGE